MNHETSHQIQSRIEEVTKSYFTKHQCVYVRVHVNPTGETLTNSSTDVGLLDREKGNFSCFDEKIN